MSITANLALTCIFYYFWGLTNWMISSVTDCILHYVFKCCTRLHLTWDEKDFFKNTNISVLQSRLCKGAASALLHWCRWALPCWVGPASPSTGPGTWRVPILLLVGGPLPADHPCQERLWSLSVVQYVDEWSRGKKVGGPGEVVVGG